MARLGWLRFTPQRHQNTSHATPERGGTLAVDPLFRGYAVHIVYTAPE
jgi:hypothetical protein